MKNAKKIRKYATLQYNTSQPLIDRIQLWSYGSNPQSFQEFVFSKLNIQKQEHILELGAGTGKLWEENYKKVPSKCNIVISDFSDLMLEKAKVNLHGLNLPIRYELINVKDIPYPNASYDKIIACHMLYHVPDLQKGLKEISRTLKSGGKLFASTVSVKHMAELKSFLSDMNFNQFGREENHSNFRVENGKEVLSPFFSKVNYYEYINLVKIPKVEPLLTYIKSMCPLKKDRILKSKFKEIEDAIGKIIDVDGYFHITGISGLFIASK